MKDFRLLSLSSLLAWLKFLSSTITNAFSGAPLPSSARGKGINILKGMPWKSIEGRWTFSKLLSIDHTSQPHPHSIVILREYFKNIPLESCNIARIIIKLLERFLKYRKVPDLAMYARNIINITLLKCWYFILILL